MRIQQLITPASLVPVLLLLFLFIVSPVNAGILKDKQCVLGKDSGTCQQYYLPFKESYTLQDYISELKKDQPQDHWYQQYRGVLDFRVEDCEEFDRYYDKIIDEGNPVHLKQFLSWLLLKAVYQLGGVNPSSQEDLDMESILRAVHTMFALLHGMYEDSMPDFDKFSNTKKCSFHRYRTKNGQISLGQTFTGYGALSKYDFVCFMTRYVLAAVGSFFVYTNENVSWLLDTVPELRSHDIVELGAGNGQLANIIRSQGINVRATDKNLIRQYGETSDVEEISAENVLKEYRNTDKPVVFLISVPGWGFGDNLEDFMKIKNAVMVVLSENEIIDDVFPVDYDKLDVFVFNLPPYFKTIYNLKKNGFKPHIYKIQKKDWGSEADFHGEL